MTSGDHPVWLFPDQERQPCKGVSRRLPRIPGNGWISGIQQSSGDQTLLLLGAIRRYFIDAVPKGKQYDYSQPAVQGVQYCSRLFAIEDSINKSIPVIMKRGSSCVSRRKNLFWRLFGRGSIQQNPVRNTRMDKAVNYVLNRRDTAETYLEDGRCSFTNNLSENAIRPFAVGRKNWLFSSSVDGANASAVVYTMVEMAKAHDLNIYGYLKFLLEHRPSKDMSDEQLAELHLGVKNSNLSKIACEL